MRKMINHIGAIIVTYVLSIGVLLRVGLTSAQTTATCRCLPGDSCWPGATEWAQLNTTVGGLLIATVPLATVCHDPNYDEAACALLLAQWQMPVTHFQSPSSVMDPYVQNRSCDPFTPREKSCTLGNYVDYAINVSCAADALAGVQFAQLNNIRLVIKNTGHDYLGKSTGKGALGLWTHNLKDIEFVDYHRGFYHGPAMRLGAGVQAFEAYAAAHAKGYRVVGGECVTVGLAGGYTQGGGHSMLSSIYGLGADQTLEMQVVTGDGRIVTASPEINSGLYFALSGGGGGTYGIVISLTVKVYPDGLVSGASFAVSTADVSETQLWDALTLYHTSLPAIVDHGAMILYYIFGGVQPTLGGFVTYPDHSAADVTTLLQPWTSAMAAQNITYSVNVTSFPNYYEHVNLYEGPFPYGTLPGSQLTGGRLLPRSVIQTSNAALTAAVRNITASGEHIFSGIALNVSHAVANNTPTSNAVLPAWREALISVVVAGYWNFSAPLSVNHARESVITDNIVPQLEALSPGSGCYLNEANFQEPDWQADFYGSNLPKLQAVKSNYDPYDLFYAPTAVGSEKWTVEPDGRLCRS